MNRIFNSGAFLMVNGDIVMDFPLEGALAFHKENKPLATLILYPQSAPYRYSPIRIDEDGRLRNFKGACPGGKLRPETVRFHRSPYTRTGHFQPHSTRRPVGNQRSGLSEGFERRPKRSWASPLKAIGATLAVLHGTWARKRNC